MKHSRIAAFVLAAILAALLALPAFAAAVPEKPAGDDVYVSDKAGILTETAEREMQKKGLALFAMTGAQVVVLTTDDRDLYDLEDYAYDVFTAWGIGSKERNNGVLLVMNSYTEDYWVTVGWGIDDVLNAGRLGQMLDRYLEPDFAKGDYSEGALTWYSATADYLADYYDVSLDKWDGETFLYDEGGEPSGEQHSSSDSGGSGSGGSLLILFILIVLVIIIVRRSRSINASARTAARAGTAIFSPRIYTTPPVVLPRAGTFGSRIGGFGGSSHSSGSNLSGFGSSVGGSHSSGGSFGGGHSGGSHGFGGGGTHGGGAGRH